ncbi:dipeptidase 2 [Boleophthalmus pectinirostris]|uniref:dipeptidase 2 n=1 Tax=Boleophthalmus pectinirostris TaxID=150288 RepID=UPI000A1C566C|nr:dipeptidase 2 [Boleophthalmus pectinirostris]XP_055010556.1 dipeptidase 2 [Boleophthalmus pectinirostris]
MYRLQCIILVSLCALISGYSEEDRVRDLMSRYPLIDGHNDLALQLRKLYNNQVNKINFSNMSKIATDISRLVAGHVQAQMFSVYVMCGAQEKDAVRLTLEQIDVLKRVCTQNQDFELVTSTQELRNSHMKHKIACMLSIEGGHSIDSSLPVLRMFYQLGVRSMALTHTCNTPWAESSSKRYNFYQRQNNSLTSFGRAVVEEMNRLGMIIDLSHTSWRTAQAVLKLSKAPVIFSHSSSYTLCNNDRNVPDSMLKELKKNQGLIMVNFHSNFISCKREANISLVADHFDHIKKIIGADSIGIGSDFEGAINFPKGLDDVSKYPALIQELLQRNWTEHELADILRQNFLRVFNKVEEVRDKMVTEPPSEVQISVEEVQNPCRLVLRHPDSPSSSSEQHLPSTLHILLAAAPLLSTLFLL